MTDDFEDDYVRVAYIYFEYICNGCSAIMEHPLYDYATCPDWEIDMARVGRETGWLVQWA